MTVQVNIVHFLEWQEVHWWFTNEASGLTDLLEARHDVPSDGADQGRDVVHEAFREAVLPGRLQSLSEIQVVDDALHLRLKRDKTSRCGNNKAWQWLKLYRVQTKNFFLVWKRRLPWVQRKTRPAAEHLPSHFHCSPPTEEPTLHGRAWVDGMSRRERGQRALQGRGNNKLRKYCNWRCENFTLLLSN